MYSKNMTTGTIAQTQQTQSVQTPQSATPTIFDIISTVGIVAIIGAFIYIGKKLQILDNLNTCIEKVKNNLFVISNYLIKNHYKFNPSELQTFSPFQLTAEGQNLIKSIGFDNIFKDHQHDFFNYISEENVKMKYDVQTASIKSIVAHYEQPYMQFLKVYFYNNPNRNLDNTAPTLGVYIRDKYLEAHPEITQ